MTNIADLIAENKALKEKLITERIGDAFNRSKFVAERLTIPADMVRARFGSSFTVEDGVVVATDAHGNRILSRSRPGELADFEDAIEQLIAGYPHRDKIMRGGGGTGAHAGNGAHSGNGAAGKTISRLVWDKLDPLDQRDALVGRGLRLVD